MTGIRHKAALTLAVITACTTMLACCEGIVLSQPAHAAPAEQQVHVEISQPVPAVRSGDSIRASVTVSLTAPAEYLEVRLRLRTPQGRLVYQKTEVRSEVAEGRHVIAFERSAENPPLDQGRYPVEIRVLATGSEPTNASGRVLVLDRDTPSQRVALVARVWSSPSVAQDGRFSIDPATRSGLRDDLTFVTGLATSRRVPLSLIVPPVILEELGRIAEGYQTVDDPTPVPAGNETPADAADTLAQLASARASEYVTLIDVPYALPDLAGLRMIDALADLETHWARTDAVLTATLGPSSAPSTAYVGGSPDEDAVDTVAARGTRRIIAPSGTLTGTEDDRATGAHPLGDTGLIAIVPDEDASAAVDLGQTEFFDVMFDRIGTGPVTLVVDIGPDGTQRPASLQRAIEMIGLADWLMFAPLDTLEPIDDADPVSLTASTRSKAPASHWKAVEAARSSLFAYREAAGPDDADVVTASRALLVAESELWAGADGSWAHADRARVMAEDITGFVTDQFSAITFEAKDVTLSGSAGEVPFTLNNGTGKHLKLTIVATFGGDATGQVTRTVEIEPMQNFITVPVDLRNSITSQLDVKAVSGDVTVAETALTVHTSYIDRLATILMVVAVLLVLLVVIRRRMAPSNAATIGVETPDGQDRHPGEGQ